MPRLGPSDPLPYRPYRLLLGGTSGAGKSTLAARLAPILQLPYVELDALQHGPGWQPRPTFDAEVADLAAQHSWITEYQYDTARPVLLDRADLVVFLLLPRTAVMRQLARRTVMRSIRRTRLWNDNVEPALWTILTDRDHIVRWAWRTHADHPQRARDIELTRPDLPIVVLCSRKDVETWLRTVEALG